MPSPWLAVEAGTDLLARARQIQRSWESLLVGGALDPELPPRATAGMRPMIVESWRRVLATGLDPTDLLPSIEADPSETRERWLEHPLGLLRHVLVEPLQMLAEESNSMVQVTDSSGLTLFLGGPDSLKEPAAEMNLVEGARCSETVNGTNGVGTALAENHPVQVFTFEHFSRHHREWVCSGAPIHDPVSGRLVGAIDLTSPWKIAHPRSLELVTTASRTTEQCLLEERRDQDARLRRRYSDLMTRSTDLLATRDGYVLVGDVPRRRTPLDVPRDGGETVLDDGSMAVAEPLGGGEAYLVRRPDSRGAKTARVKSLERAERRARELAIEQAALRQVTMLVAREPSPEQLFAVATEQVARILDVPHVRLVRCEPDGSVVVGGFSECDHGPFPVGSRLPLDSAGVIAAVRQTGRAARVDDYAHVSGEIAAVARRAGMRSAVATPIVVERRLWGAMVVLTPRHEPLPEDTEARLTDFTELVATAIANAESREARAVLTDEQAALRRVATLVAQGVPSDALFSSVCDEVEALAGGQASAVVRFETDGTVTVMGDHAALHPVGARVKPDPDYVVAEVHRTGRAARFDTDDPAAPGMPGVVRAERVRSALASPIVVAGELWGAITTVSRERAFAAGMERRLADFTELVATAISSLHARAELAASRARIAAAADDERRRVVRDLHDGAQQRLVHTVITLQLAQQALTKGVENAPLLVREALEQAEQAIAEVRELAHGILPAVLTHGGLPAGIDALASRAPVRVEIDVSVGRLPAPIEATAYFVVAEALTNVAKHASAGHAEVVARIENRMLRVEVRDDGVGGASPAGTGLVGLADRLAVFDGRLEVDSPPDAGTRLTATIPLPRSDRSAIS
jgi:signal transduction histidine kinase